MVWKEIETFRKSHCLQKIQKIAIRCLFGQKNIYIYQLSLCQDVPDKMILLEKHKTWSSSPFPIQEAKQQHSREVRRPGSYCGWDPNPLLDPGPIPAPARGSSQSLGTPHILRSLCPFPPSSQPPSITDAITSAPEWAQRPGPLSAVC